MKKRIKLWWKSIRFFRYYIVADSADNSISFSKKLYKHIARHTPPKVAPQVYVFKIPLWGTYGFTLDPQFDKETQLAEIQYNEKYRTIGFESLCPTVSQILYSYNLPADSKIKLTVSVRRLGEGRIIYNIEKP